jgi:hypothetical protein
MTTPSWITRSVDSAAGAGGVAAAAATHNAWLLVAAPMLVMVRLVVTTLCRMAERRQLGKYSKAQRHDMIEWERARGKSPDPDQP